MLKAVRTMLIVLLNIVFYGLVVFGGVQLCRVGYSFACEAISEDDGEFEVAKRLSNQDLVGNPAAFYVHMQLMKREGTDMQKGIYTLNSSMTYEEIIRVIYGL